MRNDDTHGAEPETAIWCGFLTIVLTVKGKFCRRGRGQLAMTI
jgi:hypothetical protein